MPSTKNSGIRINPATIGSIVEIAEQPYVPYEASTSMRRMRATLGTSSMTEGDRQPDAHRGVEAADHRAQHDGVEQQFPGEHLLNHDCHPERSEGSSGDLDPSLRSG